MANRTIRAAEKRQVFITALESGFSIAKASELAGIGRRTAYDWRSAEEEFRRAWDEAVEHGTDLIEDEALRRARDGVEKPVFHQGKIVGHVRDYSDLLLIFLLKARRPEKFKDRVANEHSGEKEVTVRWEREPSDLDRARAVASLFARLRKDPGALGETAELEEVLQGFRTTATPAHQHHLSIPTGASQGERE